MRLSFTILYLATRQKHKSAVWLRESNRSIIDGGSSLIVRTVMCCLICVLGGSLFEGEDIFALPPSGFSVSLMCKKLHGVEKV